MTVAKRTRLHSLRSQHRSQDHSPVPKSFRAFATTRVTGHRGTCTAPRSISKTCLLGTLPQLRLGLFEQLEDLAFGAVRISVNTVSKLLDLACLAFHVAQGRSGILDLDEDTPQGNDINLSGWSMAQCQHSGQSVSNMQVVQGGDDLVLVYLEVADVLGKHFLTTGNVNCKICFTLQSLPF